MTHSIQVVQDGSIFYMRDGDAVSYWIARIKVQALSRHAAERAREAFERMVAAEFPEAQIKWARSIWSTDGSADTLRSLSFRNDLAYRSRETNRLYTDELAATTE